MKCNDGYRFKVVTRQFSNYKHNMHTDNHNYHSAFQNYKVQQLLEKNRDKFNSHICRLFSYMMNAHLVVKQNDSS